MKWLFFVFIIITYCSQVR